MVTGRTSTVRWAEDYVVRPRQETAASVFGRQQPPRRASSATETTPCVPNIHTLQTAAKSTPNLRSQIAGTASLRIPQARRLLAEETPPISPRTAAPPPRFTHLRRRSRAVTLSSRTAILTGFYPGLAGTYAVAVSGGAQGATTGRAGSHAARAADTQESVSDSDDLLEKQDEDGEFGWEYEPEDTSKHIKGWRLYVLTVTLWLTMFMSGVEVSIVSTSLLAIANDLEGFKQSSWVITAYMLTNTAWLIISAKLSDVYGRKVVIIASTSVFVVFSAGCALADDMMQLIVFRALQGFGSAGIVTLVMLICFEMVPAARFPIYATLLSAVFVASHIAGPLIGGSISLKSTWRWVFMLNVPIGFIVILLLFFILPSDFPLHLYYHSDDHDCNASPEGRCNCSVKPPSSASSPSSPNHPKLRPRRPFYFLIALRKIDFAGAFLLLAASVMLVAAVSGIANGNEWSSPVVLTLLIMSGPLWLAFLGWEYIVSKDHWEQEPVFPWRFVKSITRMGLILMSFSVGIPFTICMIQIPQRYQNVNGNTALAAGYRILPLTLLGPLGIALATPLIAKLKISPVLILIVGGAFQVIGLALLSTSNGEFVIPDREYAFQVITGLGMGLNIGTTNTLTPIVVGKKDFAVATGAINQARLMGGSISLALLTGIMNAQMREQLLTIMTPEQFTRLLSSTDVLADFTPASRALLRTHFTSGYNSQMRIVASLAAAQIVAALMLWRVRKPITRAQLEAAVGQD